MIVESITAVVLTCSLTVNDPHVAVKTIQGTIYIDQGMSFDSPVSLSGFRGIERSEWLRAEGVSLAAGTHVQRIGGAKLSDGTALWGELRRNRDGTASLAWFKSPMPATDASKSPPIISGTCQKVIHNGAAS